MGLSCSYAKQSAERNYGIEVTISFDYWSEIPVIHKCCAHRNTGTSRQKSNLILHFPYHFPSYFTLALDFNNIRSTARLKQKIYLQTTSQPIS